MDTKISPCDFLKYQEAKGNVYGNNKFTRIHLYNDMYQYEHPCPAIDY